MRYFALAFLALIAASIVVSAVPACDQVKHAGQVFVDCIAADQTKLKSDADALWKEHTDGKSWSQIGADAESLAITDTETIAGCALATLVEEYLAPAPGRAASPPAESQSARATLEQFRARHGGVTYRTSSGDL